MTIDSSALIAMLFAEPNHLDLVDRILEADSARVSAPTLVETSMVFIARRGSGAGREVDELVKELGITVVPLGEPEWHAATAAFHKYGRGRHRASLNFGDCLAYATAAVAGDSLLFVGNDFSRTGITPA